MIILKDNLILACELKADKMIDRKFEIDLGSVQEKPRVISLFGLFEHITSMSVYEIFSHATQILP